RQKIDMRLREVNHSDSLFAAIQKLQQMLQERDALEFRLKNIAHSDSLTGLSNRFALEEYIRFLENQPSQLSQTCLMIIDIDHFKQVNDQYGHIIGDQVIQLVAERLKANVRATDLLVRYGGDEFLVLIENIEMDQALIVADKIRAEVAERYILTALGDEIQISVSIGVAIGAVSWMALLSNADDALFKAKAKGRNVVAEV
ncbi:MAG: GGDEF domain-containing protein, partial [Acinetobacter pseudolwoffii]|nr:GGDEF domain-containing protein [Acinetobacter pseudolwoffii]